MIDLNDLSAEEINELDKKIKEWRKTEEGLVGYKVTFFVRFGPEEHRGENIADSLEAPDSLEEFLIDNLAHEFEQWFDLRRPEGIGGIAVEEVSAAELQKVKFF